MVSEMFLAHIVCDIPLYFSYNEYLVSVFLDIARAYDAVDMSPLKERLESFHIPPHISKVTVQMCYDRSI